MDPLEFVTDRSIRRALGFAGLAVGMVMLSLSFDILLALRCGADLAGIAAVTMLAIAWHAPRSDIRHSEAWVLLEDLAPEMVRGRSRRDLENRLRAAMRRRLLWHAERVALLALALWTLALGVFLVRML